MRLSLKELAIIFVSITAVLSSVGCRPHTENAGFIKRTDLLTVDPRVPFDGFWSAPNTDLRKYKKVYVAPIDTTHLVKMDWWQGFSAAVDTTDTNPQAEAKYLAGVWRDDLIASFKQNTATQYQVVDQPDDQTLVIELAIVEVVPTKIWLNAISYVVVGGVDNGTTAMEGRMRVGPKGDPIVRFKDTEHGQYSIISEADMTWYSHSKHTLEHWSDQLEELCSSAPDAHVDSATAFTLRPW